MSGVDVHTFRPMPLLDHIAQSITLLIATDIGERVLREWVGVPRGALLGQNMTEDNILRWCALIWSVVEVFEPRFKIKRFGVDKAARAGELGLVIVGEYRPDAASGWQQAKLYIVNDASGVSIKSAE